MVLCTVRKLSPNTSNPPLPKQPEPFLDSSQFDNKK